MPSPSVSPAPLRAAKCPLRARMPQRNGLVRSCRDRWWKICRALFSMKTVRVRGVLLDVDGTLLDSNDAHALAWRDAFDACGFDIPFERVRPLIGMGGDKLIETLAKIRDESSDVGREISER